MMCVILKLLFVITVIVVDKGSEGSPILEYATAATSDICISVGDDSRNAVSLGSPFTYFGTSYSTIYINSNGILSFAQFGSSHFTPVNIATTAEPMMAILNDDFKDFGTNLYYRETTRAVDLDRIDLFVSQLFPSLTGFASSSAFVVTWNRINHFAGPDPKPEVTMQAVLVRSNLSPLVLYLYDNVDYLKRTYPTIGVTSGNGANVRTLCASGTPNTIDVDILAQVSSACPGVFGFTLVAGASTACINAVNPTGSCTVLNVAERGGCDAIPPGTPPPPIQGARVLGDICDNCIVSGGLGFNYDPEDCSCFYTCYRGLPFKPPGESDWISHRRCCPCHQTFSKKLLTCVAFTDKRSDCYNEALVNNRCNGQVDGDSITRPGPGNAMAGSYLCSGYIECEQVGEMIVPNPVCCPDGSCFDDASETCESQYCDDGYCNTLPLSRTDDCDCEMTPAPLSECAFVPDENDISRFMGAENMVSYTCAAGTCWDQTKCTCVRTNNTGYDECSLLAGLDFDIDFSARDNLGNTIDTVTDSVALIGGRAVFESEGQINVAGLANVYLSNTFIFHFQFTLLEDGTSSNEETQCFVGNCLVNNIGDPPSVDTLAVTVDRDDVSDGAEINIFLTYQDRLFMGDDSMESRKYEITGDFEVEVTYDFWLIYCGDEETVMAGVINEADMLVGDVVGFVPDSTNLVQSQSGFLFGTCLVGDAYEGQLDNIEMWRWCKPFGTANFLQAYDLIKAEVTG